MVQVAQDFSTPPINTPPGLQVTDGDDASMAFQEKREALNGESAAERLDEMLGTGAEAKPKEQFRRHTKSGEMYSKSRLLVIVICKRS